METPILDGIIKEAASHISKSNAKVEPDYGVITAKKDLETGNIVSVGRVDYPVQRLDKYNPSYKDVNKRDVICDLRNNKNYITIVPSSGYTPKDGSLIHPIEDKYISTNPNDTEKDNLGELALGHDFLEKE